MAEIYGSQWTNEYSEQPNGQWFMEIKKLTMPPQIIRLTFNVAYDATHVLASFFCVDCYVGRQSRNCRCDWII